MYTYDRAHYKSVNLGINRPYKSAKKVHYKSAKKNSVFLMSNQWFCFLFSKLPPPFVLGIYVTFLEDWEIYIIVLKTEFEVNIVLQIVQHILMKGERNGKNEHVLSAFYKT